MQGGELSAAAVAGRTTAGACLQRSDRARTRNSCAGYPDRAIRTLREYIRAVSQVGEEAAMRDLPPATPFLSICMNVENCAVASLASGGNEELPNDRAGAEREQELDEHAGTAISRYGCYLEHRVGRHLDDGAASDGLQVPGTGLRACLFCCPGPAWVLPGSCLAGSWCLSEHRAAAFSLRS